MTKAGGVYKYNHQLHNRCFCCLSYHPQYQQAQKERGGASGGADNQRVPSLFLNDTLQGNTLCVLCLEFVNGAVVLITGMIHISWLHPVTTTAIWALCPRIGVEIHYHLLTNILSAGDKI